MKLFILPLTLISFTVLCLSIVHVENIDTLTTTSEALQKKHQQYQVKNSLKTKDSSIHTH